MPSTRPRDEITAAVIDAAASLNAAEDGSVPRSDLKETAVRREVFANLALARYLQAHPEAKDLAEGEQYNAIEDGLGLLASEAVIWLLSKGHLEEPSPGRVRLTSKRVQINGRQYTPGTHREADLFFSLRRPAPGRVDLIRESITELGDLREFFPVLVDTDGNVVDGRHRRAVDPDWPASKAKVPAGARLAVATAANRVNAWTKDDWLRLRAQREHVAGHRRTTRILARLALMENPARSDREISRLIGGPPGGHTVGKVRSELEETAQITQYSHSGGRGVTEGSPVESRPHGVLTDEMQQQVDDLVAREYSRSQVMAATGLKANTAQRAMEKARERQRASQPEEPRPAPVTEDEPEACIHDWGPWIQLRECAECGEQDTQD